MSGQRPAASSQLWGVVLLGLVWAPDAMACSVCFSSSEANRLAFLVTTIALSLMPLAMVGGGVWWLVRRSRRGQDLSHSLSDPFRD